MKKPCRRWSRPSGGDARYNHVCGRPIAPIDRAARRGRERRLADMLLLIGTLAHKHDAALAFLEGVGRLVRGSKSRGVSAARFGDDLDSRHRLPLFHPFGGDRRERSDFAKRSGLSAVVSWLRQAFSSQIAEVLPVDLESRLLENRRSPLGPRWRALLHRADKGFLIRHLRPAFRPEFQARDASVRRSAARRNSLVFRGQGKASHELPLAGAACFVESFGRARRR